MSSRDQGTGEEPYKPYGSRPSNSDGSVCALVDLLAVCGCGGSQDDASRHAPCLQQESRDGGPRGVVLVIQHKKEFQPALCATHMPVKELQGSHASGLDVRPTFRSQQLGLVTEQRLPL